MKTHILHNSKQCDIIIKLFIYIYMKINRYDFAIIINIFHSNYANTNLVSPNYNVKKIARCPEHLLIENWCNISHFDSQYDVVFDFVKFYHCIIQEILNIFLLINMNCILLTGMFILIKNDQNVMEEITRDRL